MKNIVLSVLLLGVFSCSSSVKINESADRAINSSVEEQKLAEFFKKPYADFNNQAYAIGKRAVLKFQKFQNNQDVKSCKEDSIAKRFFTNACTKALELCQKTQINSFVELDGAFISNIYSHGIAGAKHVKQKLSENKNDKFYQKMSAIIEFHIDRMSHGRKDIIDSYFDGRSFSALGMAFGSAHETSDKQDDFQNCSSRLADEADESSFGLSKAKYASLIPQ